MQNSFVIVNSKSQFLCSEIYRKNLAKLPLHSRHTNPCVWAFQHPNDCAKFIQRFKQYNVCEPCSITFDNTSERFVTSDDTFAIHQKVCLKGVMSENMDKNMEETYFGVELTDKYSDDINSLIYTQHLHIFVPLEKMKMYNGSFSVVGLFLEPLIDNLSYDEHVRIIKQNLTDSL